MNVELPDGEGFELAGVPVALPWGRRVVTTSVHAAAERAVMSRRRAGITRNA